MINNQIICAMMNITNNDLKQQQHYTVFFNELTLSLYYKFTKESNVQPFLSKEKRKQKKHKNVIQTDTLHLLASKLNGNEKFCHNHQYSFNLKLRLCLSLISVYSSRTNQHFPLNNHNVYLYIQITFFFPFSMLGFIRLERKNLEPVY